MNHRCSNKRITEVFSHNSLENRRCFLLGGGPSLKGFDYTILKNEFTIGTNKTFIAFSPTIIYGMDMKFYNSISQPGPRRNQRDIHEAWNNYTGYKVFLCPKRKHTFGEDIYLIDRTLEKVISLDLREGIYPGKNSGFGALTMSIAMGCKEIYLLGYDMEVFGKETHFHEGYPNQDLRDFSNRLEKFKKEFEEFSDSIASIGIEVINLSPLSSLECFEKDIIVNVLNKKELVPVKVPSLLDN